MKRDDSSTSIVRGIMVSFDIFNRDNIENVNQNIKKMVGFEPKIEKSSIAFLSGPQERHEITHYVWNIDSIQDFLGFIKLLFDKHDRQFDAEFYEKYVEGHQIQGYDDPNLPYYLLMASIDLNGSALNSKGLHKILFQLGLAVRLFIESLGGFTNSIANLSPKASIVTQFWIKVDKKDILNIKDDGLEFLKKIDAGFENYEQKLEFAKNLIDLEPFDLSSPTGDIHSHMIGPENIVLILGHTTAQFALGGLRTPYILYLSYTDGLLQKSDFPGNVLISTMPHTLFDNSYALLIALISMLIFLTCISFESIKIDHRLQTLGQFVTAQLSENTGHVSSKQVAKISECGTKISTLLIQLGIFSRHNERLLNMFSSGKGLVSVEVPIPHYKFIYEYTYLGDENKGYLGNLASQILNTFKNAKTSLSKQEVEINSLRTHFLDITVEEKQSLLPPGSPYTGFRMIEELLRKVDGYVKIIDPYVDEGTLDILSKVTKEVPIFLLTTFKRGNGKEKRFVKLCKKFKIERPRFEIRKCEPKLIHDRFIFTKSKGWAIGTSIKDLGKKMSMITALTEKSLKDTEELFKQIWATSQNLI